MRDTLGAFTRATWNPGAPRADGRGHQIAEAHRKSVNVPTVSASSREPVAPVTRASVRRTTPSSAGMNRGTNRPMRRARASLARRGSHPSAAASR
jgi:hypothetical protein